MIKQITSKDHPLVKHLTHLRKNRDFRHECGRTVIEGEKLVKDLLKMIPYRHLIVSDHLYLPETYEASHVLIATEEIMEKISGLSSPPSMIAEVDLPKPSTLEGLNFILALDRLQDPGNLGTLYRTARAFGWEGIFLIGSNVDAYNDKALRASQGATLLVPTRVGTHEEFLAYLQENSLPAYIADTEGEKPKRIKRGCLILGTEGEGVSESLKEKLPKVTIPMQNNVESLNVAVAGGILLHLMKEPA